MTQVTREVQAAYDRIVLAYAERNDGSMPEALISYAERLLEHVGSAGRVIDIGCGTGRDMAWFEARGIAVTGVDISREMLRYARGKTAGDLVSMEMCKLGFRDSCFDGAWSCASLLHLPKTEASRALSETRRVLKAGSALILSLQEGSEETWEGGYCVGIRRLFARYSADELRALLPATGFQVRDIQAFPGRGRDWLVSTCLAL